MQKGRRKKSRKTNSWKKHKNLRFSNRKLKKSVQSTTVLAQEIRTQQQQQLKQHVIKSFSPPRKIFSKSIYQTKPNFKICKNISKGACRKGQQCPYAHSREELKKIKHLNKIMSTEPCKNFHYKGYCSYGSKCQYLHGELTLINKRFIYNPRHFYFDSPKDIKSYPERLQNLKIKFTSSSKDMEKNLVIIDLTKEKKRLPCFTQFAPTRAINGHVPHGILSR